MKQKLILWALFFAQRLARDIIMPKLRVLDERIEKQLMKTMFPRTTKILGEQEQKDDVK